MQKTIKNSLRDNQGNLQRDPTKLGKLMTVLPPCLRNDLTDAKRREFSDLGKRVPTEDNDFFNFEKPIGMDVLVNLHPKEMSFYPSGEILKKLVLRAVQVKQPEIDLWEGFNMDHRPYEVIRLEM